MPRKKRIQAEQEQEKPAPKKKDYMITVTEDEYDAHREELEKLDNVVIFVDDADRDHWMGAQWRLGVDLDPDIFVHEDGAGLERIGKIFAEKHIEASVDEVFSLDDVNKALEKVATGRSKGKTVIKIV